MTSSRVSPAIMLLGFLLLFYLYIDYGSIPSVLLLPLSLFVFSILVALASSGLASAERRFPFFPWRYEARILKALALGLAISGLGCFLSRKWFLCITIFVVAVGIWGLRATRVKNGQKQKRKFHRFPGWKMTAIGISGCYFVLSWFESFSSELYMLPDIPRYSIFRKVEHPFADDSSIVADSKGNIYVLLEMHRTVQKYDPNGRFLFSFFNLPRSKRIGIAIDPEDRLFVHGGSETFQYDTEGRKVRTFASGVDRYGWYYAGNGEVRSGSPPVPSSKQRSFLSDYTEPLKPGYRLYIPRKGHGFMAADGTEYEAVRQSYIFRAIRVFPPNNCPPTLIKPNPVSNLFTSGSDISFAGALLLLLVQTVVQKFRSRQIGLAEVSSRGKQS